MKFPRELSQLRFNLLSDEDKEIYNYEHSPFYSYTAKLLDLNLNNDNSDELNDLDDLTLMDKIVNEEVINILLDEFIPELHEQICNCLSEKEYKKLIECIINNKEDVLNQIEHTIENYNSLNEAFGNGTDMLAWTKDMGWIGKLAGIGLGMILGPLVMALIAGKNNAAIKLLERYMNKLVEIIDDGTYKKRGFMDSIKSFFGRKNRNTKSFEGDQSRACFRAQLEMIERRMCTNTITLGKMCGIINGVSDVASGNNNGGLQYFYENVVHPLNNTLNIGQ